MQLEPYYPIPLEPNYPFQLEPYCPNRWAITSYATANCLCLGLIWNIRLFSRLSPLFEFYGNRVSLHNVNKFCCWNACIFQKNKWFFPGGSVMLAMGAYWRLCDLDKVHQDCTAHDVWSFYCSNAGVHVQTFCDNYEPLNKWNIFFLFWPLSRL